MFYRETSETFSLKQFVTRKQEKSEHLCINQVSTKIIKLNTTFTTQSLCIVALKKNKNNNTLSYTLKNETLTKLQQNS